MNILPNGTEIGQLCPHCDDKRSVIRDSEMDMSAGGVLVCPICTKRSIVLRPNPKTAYCLIPITDDIYRAIKEQFEAHQEGREKIILANGIAGLN